MAVKRASKPPKQVEVVKPKRGRPPSPYQAPDEKILIACNAEWKYALASEAKSRELTISDLVGLAVDAFVKSSGGKPMPPRIFSPSLSKGLK